MEVREKRGKGGTHGEEEVDKRGGENKMRGKKGEVEGMREKKREENGGSHDEEEGERENEESAERKRRRRASR